jgi:arsenite-transporting ATPase
MRVRHQGSATVLEVDLPFTERGELELGRRNGELLVRVGPYRRALLLPDSLSRRSVAGARLHEGRLLVTFAAAQRPSG